MQLNLTDTVAIVTGANSGIGLAAVRALLDEGACVVGVDRDPSTFAELGTERASAVIGDVTDPDSGPHVVRHTLDAFGRIDILVNSAGLLAVREGGFLSVPDHDWTRLWDVNVMGYVRMARAVLPTMVEQGHGSLVHVSSVRAHLPDPKQPDYSVTKAAVTSLSKSLAQEFTSKGIRSNVVSPGSVRTPAWDAPGGVIDTLVERHNLPREEALEYEMRVHRRLPAGRPATAEEVARVITFLASPTASGYVTGSDYLIDGGLIPTT